MLLKYGADGATLFERAIESEDGDDIVENFEMLLKNDVEANVKHIQLGITPLHNAIDLDDINIELVNLLIRFGADVNTKDFDLETPLHHAFDSRVRDFKLLKVLMQNGANPNLKNEVDESTIEKTFKYKSTKYFKAILYNQIYL